MFGKYPRTFANIIWRGGSVLPEAFWLAEVERKIMLAAENWGGALEETAEGTSDKARRKLPRVSENNAVVCVAA